MEVHIFMSNKQFPILEEIEAQDYANYRHMMFTLPIALDAHRIVETGLGNGHSTRIFGESLSQLPVSSDRYLYTLELNPDQKVVDNINELFYKKYSYNVNWELIVGKSTDNAKIFQEEGNIDLLYLDSDHSYENVLAELNAFKPYLSPKAWIMLDDSFMNGAHTEVYVAAKSWAVENNWKYMDFTETRGFGKENIITNGKMILRRD